MADADIEIRGAAVPHMSYALIISGLDVRYVSHDGWDAADLPIAVGTYDDHSCITHISPLGGRLDVAEGIAGYDTITITMGTNGPFSTTENDPGVELGRIGYRDATNHARLITTIAEALASPATIEVDRDVSGWTVPGTIHIGAETFTVSGTAGDGSGGNPYRFTGVGRRRRATAPARHSVGGLTRPWVVSEPVFWKWRRAILYARAVRPDGTFGDLVEVMRGFIDGPPDISATTVSLGLMPLTAVLDRKVSGTAEVVRLVDTHHYFEGSAATTLQHAQAPLWPMYSELVTIGSASGSTELFAPTAPYEYFFDVTLPVDHPRHGLLALPGPLVRPQAPDAIAAAGEFTLAAGQPSANIAAGDLVESVPGVPDLQTIDLLEPRADEVSLLSWPEGVLALLDGWAPGDHTGADGAWVDVRVEEASQAVILSINTTVARPMRLLFWGLGGAWDQSFGPRPDGLVPAARLLHYPIDFADPADPVHTVRLADRGGFGAATWTRAVDVNGDTSADFGYAIRGICPGGWYQSGERYILVDADILIPASGVATVQITYHDRGADEQRVATCRIVSSTSLATGYALEVHEQDRQQLPSFGNWGAAEPVTIRPAVRFTAKPDRDVLLTVLHSNGGALATDPAWDREAFGAGLLEDDVDQPSFRATPTPPGLGTWSPLVERGKKLREIIEPILRVTSSALVMRRDSQGRCRLTRVSVGIESPLDAVESITDDEWVAEPWPETRPDRAIINRFELLTNHADGGAGDAGVTVEFEDDASIAANGEGETLKVELRGLYLDGADAAEATATFRDLVARWAEMAGYVRKGYVGSIGIGKAWRIGLASTVLASSSLLRGRQAAFRITGAAVRVLEYRIPLWPGDGDVADLRMSSHGANATGWAPALYASSRIDATTVKVSASVYAPDEHPITGADLVDLDFFSEGDAVLVRQRYDQDTYVSTTIDTIDRSTRNVTFADAHGLTAAAGMGIVEPAAYDSQSTTVSPSGYNHKAMASIADSDGTLGAAADDGFTLL